MRRLFTMPPQLFRILLLAVRIVVAYSVARYFLTPRGRTFGGQPGESLITVLARD